MFENEANTIKKVCSQGNLYTGMLLTLKGCCPCVVINKVLDSLFSVSHLPALRQGQLVHHGATRVLPLSGLTLVVHIVHSAIGQLALL